MKLNCLSVIVLLLSMVVVSCDDTTDTIGQSLTDNMDHVKIYTDTFTVSTQSIKAGPVLSRTVIVTLIFPVTSPQNSTYSAITQF